MENKHRPMRARTFSLDARARRQQRMHAGVILMVPALGAIAAIVWLVVEGLHAVDLALFAGMHVFTLVGIKVGFHRLLSHRSFTASRGLRKGLAICGSMAAQGAPIYWVANHRLHHAASDEGEDLHSPHTHPASLLGKLWHSHVGWMFHHPMVNPLVFAKELLSDRDILYVNRHYTRWVTLGLVVPALLSGMIHGSPVGLLSGFLFGGLLRIFTVQHLVFLGNSICHLWGRRDYETKDHSRNVPWLGPVTFGGAWHNTHHAFPSYAVIGFAWWHFDVHGWLILLFARLGWASDVRIPTADARAERRRQTAALAAPSASDAAPERAVESAQ